MKALVVTSQFGDYKYAEHITDPDKIEEVLASEHAHHVHVINLPDEPKGE